MRVAINGAEIFLASQLHNFSALGILHLQIDFHLNLPAARWNKIGVSHVELKSTAVTPPFGEQKSALLYFVLEKVLVQRRGDAGRNDDAIAHADSSPRRQRLMLRTNPTRLSPPSMVAAGRQFCGCQENQPQFPSTGAGPLADCEPGLKAGGFVPSFNLRSPSTKKLSGPVCG